MSTGNIIYRYAATDLLSAPPFHYMYTPFEGEQMFDVYFQCRASLIDRLSTVRKDDNTVTTWRGLQERVSLSDLGDEPVVVTGDRLETEEALIAIVRDQVLACGTVTRESLSLIRELTRKFEVSKRLRRTYGKDMKAIDRQSAPLSAYACLAFLVAALSDGRDRTRFHNALLKLLDIIAGADVAELSTLAAGCAEHAARLETDLTRALMQRHGLHLSEQAANA